MLGSTTAQVQASADSAISSDKWKDLLSQCRRVFPKASLLASAIMPARGRHPFNPVIHHSNRNLQQVCDGMGVHYRDHTAVFTTSSGAPRMALYQNAILPTRKGTARLAENLFARKQADSIGTKRGSDHRPRPTGRLSSSPMLHHRSIPPPVHSPTPRMLPTNNHTSQSSQPENPPTLPHSPADPHYSEVFPPLPTTTLNPTHPLRRPDSRPTTTRGTNSYGSRETYTSPPQPPPMMPPPVYPPMLFPSFPRSFPPAFWQWPHFMPLPPNYGQF